MAEKDDNQRRRRKATESRPSGLSKRERGELVPEEPGDEEEEPGLSLEEAHNLDAALAEETKDEIEVAYIDEDEDVLIIGAQDEAVVEDMAQYTEDEDIKDELAERQKLNQGSPDLLMKLRQHHSKTPDLSADDIDAAWDDANVGDETVGGLAPTPDQDRVDELGEAVGLTYEDDEPLGIQDKMREREQDRWELDPESAEDEEEEYDDFDEYDDEDDY